MLLNNLIKNSIITIGLVLAILSRINAVEPENKHSISFEFLPAQTFEIDRAWALGEALNFSQWPTTDIMRVAPVVDKAAIERSGLISRESKSYNTVELAQNSWGIYRWSADYFVENKQPLPTELPADRVGNIIEHLPPHLKNDPDYVEKYIQKALERYRDSLKRCLQGTMVVEMCLTPNSKAAGEYLLSKMVACTMPLDAIVKQHLATEKIPNLGILNFVKTNGNRFTIIEFVRDNIAVIIDARGEFTDEGLALARKIDDLIKQQPVLTYEQLMARRPVITMANKVKKDKYDVKSVDFEVLKPAGVEVINSRAFDEEDASLAVKDGKITLRGKTGTKKVKITAITDELLCTTVEQEVVLDE
jgi:hypothetical protein